MMFERVRRSLGRRLARASAGSAEPVQLPPISDSELEQVRLYFHRPKFFVLGYPRSGTTLLARLLRLSPDLSCRWQGHFASGPGDWLDRFGQPALAEWLALSSNRWSAEGEPSLTALARIAADFAMERVAEAEGSMIVGDKTPTPRLDWAVERLSRLYPEAKVIAIVRDGRDAALSQRIQAFIDQPETLSPLDLRLRKAIEKKPEDFGAGGRSIFSRGWLQRVTRNWALTVGRGHRLAQDLYSGRYYSLRYEDLLAKPMEELHSLWQFLGLEAGQVMHQRVTEALSHNPAADWHLETAPKLARHLQRGTAGGWTAWFTAQDSDLFLAEAQTQLAQWHYLD